MQAYLHVLQPVLTLELYLRLRSSGAMVDKVVSQRSGAFVHMTKKGDIYDEF